MTPSLERLAELVRQAEAKTRAKKLGAELRHASEQFRAAEGRARAAAQRSREARPRRLRELEQADVDEHHLKDLVRKLAQFKASLDADSNAEALIATAQAEIEQTRRDARADLEAIQRETDEARRELRTAMDHYQQLRRELDRLQPQLAAEYAAEDRLLWDAETHFPGGQLHLLAREVEAGSAAFGMLAKMEQYAQLKLWIGRYRLYQATNDAEPTEEGQALFQRVFHQLKGLSKTHEPGYIEAFRQDFNADWTAYVAEAQEQLHQAAESARRARDGEPPHRHEPPAREPEKGQPPCRESGLAALEGLRALLDRVRLPGEGAADFLDLLRQAVGGLGASEPALLELAMPHRDLITGADAGLRALRRNLDRLHQDEGKGREPAPGSFDDLVPAAPRPPRAAGS